MRHGYADAAVGLNRIDMIIGDTMGGFNRILEYFNRTNSREALQALIDSPLLGRWNYVGVTDDYLVLTSREVAGDAVRKVWTYYYPRKKHGGKTRGLTSYQCAARQYATLATAAFDEHDNITDVFSASQNPPVLTITSLFRSIQAAVTARNRHSLLTAGCFPEACCMK